MNLFFIFTLLISFLIALLLFLLLLKRLEINWQKRNKHAASYLLPVFFTLLFVCHVGFDLRARTLDFLDILQHNTDVLTASTEQMQVINHRLEVEDRIFILPLNNLKLKPETYYRINYSERSRIVLALEELSEVPPKESQD